MKATLPRATPVGRHTATGFSFTDATVLRPGAMDAFQKPSVENGKPIPRTKPVLIGSTVPPGKHNANYN